MRRVVILCTVPLLVLAAAGAGLFVWNSQQQQAGPAEPGAVPSTSSTPSTDGAPSGDASELTGEQQAAKAISSCRREVALAESVLGAAGDGTGHWREHVQAQTDLTLGRNTDAQTKAIFKRSKLAGPSDVAKYQTAKAGYKAESGACKAVKGADEEQTDHLAVCRARLDKVTSALTNADLVMKDWSNHLADMRKSAGGEVHDAQAVWLDTWRKAPPNLEKYAAAMDTLAKTKSCPR
ncbi:hypothetical protein [Microlunatus speluncae]|uniref:hypothetical protein n=1 Tax=Microlunatus speluncae TaxID=2594267 RepID=UPI0012664162|nr:hypothetical protein [Microlunatus speluncae]